MRKEITEGEMIPKWYGLAYRRYERGYTERVCYPIPINVIVRLYKEFYYWLVRGCFKAKWEEEIRIAENRGFEAGYEWGVAET